MVKKLKDKLLATGYFIDNDWLDKYCDLIKKNRDTKKEKYKTQKHHILQRAYYKLINKDVNNNNDNCVNLLYSDHILAHYYLCFCTKKTLARSNRFAFFFMLNTSPEDFNEEYFINCIADNYNMLYEQVKKDFSENNYGKNLSEETRKKISKQMIGKNCKPVICLETLKIYSSCTKAAEDIGTDSSNISRCCLKEYYTHNGLHFRYYDKNIDYSKIQIPDKVKPRVKQVRCIELDTVYNSIIEASKLTGVSKSGISKCCLGHYKTSGGYHWKYIE